MLQICPHFEVFQKKRSGIHDQALADRGFTLNSNILKTSMGTETAIAKYMITERMTSSNLKPHTIEITKPRLKALRNTHSSYRILL